MNAEELDMLDTLQQLRERRGEIDQAIKDIESQLAAKYAVGEVLVGDDGESVAVFEQGMKFDADKCAEVLSVVPELLKLVQVETTKITSANAKKLLPPETYEKCKIPNGQPKLKFLGDGE